MTCRELNTLFDSGQRPEAWPEPARRHFEACERCRGVAAVLKDSGPSAVAPQLLNSLVRDVTRDLGPVRRLSPDPRAAAWFSIIALAAVAVLTVFMGTRGWKALGERRWVLFTPLLAALPVLAYALARERRPAGSLPRLRTAAWPIPAAVFLLAGFTIYPWAPVPASYQHGPFCMIKGLLCAAAIAVTAVPLLRRGYFTTPARAAAALGLLGGFSGLVLQTIFCPLLERSHVFFWHAAVIPLSALLAAWLLAGKLSSLHR